jgi:hypothetical protein
MQRHVGVLRKSQVQIAGPICPLDHMFFQPLRFAMAA